MTGWQVPDSNTATWAETEVDTERVMKQQSAVAFGIGGGLTSFIFLSELRSPGPTRLTRLSSLFGVGAAEFPLYPDHLSVISDGRPIATESLVVALAGLGLLSVLSACGCGANSTWSIAKARNIDARGLLLHVVETIRVHQSREIVPIPYSLLYEYLI
ncbi:hypothetical protein CERZMDRAFT_84085 [Cercospora zeae-maydis SCOH1-5]|uniref:Uncharacterized protein n=1 Tax=Cercospora zeae-maydis SCOH1-5 TaxID=717836 RepID=A0A6A6FJ03_9PEZI|nr:hypothetical protein CERZMDRAFT_84085 [Cercospora zeae-maydis SCOH1-5]